MTGPNVYLYKDGAILTHGRVMLRQSVYDGYRRRLMLFLKSGARRLFEHA